MPTKRRLVDTAVPSTGAPRAPDDTVARLTLERNAVLRTLDTLLDERERADTCRAAHYRAGLVAAVAAMQQMAQVAEALLRATEA